MPPAILLDLSRLLSRADRTAPTGIDRVELAYARHLIDTGRDRLGFAAMNRLGRFGALPGATAIRFVEAVERVWAGDGAAVVEQKALGRRLLLVLLASGEAALHARIRRAGRPTVYLLVSHHHLDRPGPIERLKRKAGARFVPLVHDLIPIQFPEYTRPGQPERHQARMDTVARLADAVIVNSDSTAEALRPVLAQAGRSPALLVAPLGVDHATRGEGAAAAGGPPYFVCVSTIEPKKNHLLLLTLWRELALSLGDRAPRLVLVGHRGWNNQNVIDMLERSPPLQAVVEEHNGLADGPMRQLLLGARAMLFPSFAEGFGLPVAEALAHGVPVLCSDLPVLRGVGGEAPEYLDPIDGAGWRAAILDYAAAHAPRRDAQLARLRHWRAPTWDGHFAAVEPLLEGVIR